MEKPKDIDGKEHRRQEADSGRSPAEAVKGKIAELQQKLASDPPAENRAEQTALPRQMPRREALKTFGKAAFAAPFIIQGIKERIFANEGNPYYSHGVSKELYKLYAYRVDPIHQRPADYVRTLLKDMTGEKDEKAREYQSGMLKKHFERERDDPHVMDSDVLNIEGNDRNFITHSRLKNGDVEIRVYYYPDANNSKIEGKLTINPHGYTRRHNGITETIQNPGTIKEEVKNLRELLMGENPAIAEAKEMIENLDMNTDMVEIAKILSRISDSSIKQKLGWKLVKKGKSLLKTQIPDMNTNFSAYGNNEFALRFSLPGYSKWIGIFVKNGNVTIENNNHVTSVSLQIITDTLMA